MRMLHWNLFKEDDECHTYVVCGEGKTKRENPEGWCGEAGLYVYVKYHFLYNKLIPVNPDI